MKKTIEIPMLVAPGGQYYAAGWSDEKGKACKHDWRMLLDGTDLWPCGEMELRQVIIRAEVDFEPPPIPAVDGVTEEQP